MRIFLNAEVHTYTTNYRSSVWSKRTTTENIIFSDSDIFRKINKKVAELTVDVSTLSKPMKICFDPACKYPRYKLKDNKDFKRVIKPLNADVIIYSSVTDRIHYSGLWYNCKHYLIDGEIHSVQADLLSGTTLHDFLSIPSDIAIEELKFDENRLVSTDVAQSLFNLFNVYTKIISNTQLDTMINSSLMNMSNEDYSSIAGMLKSKDDETFKLGLKMLVGFNTNNNAVRIGSLLIECCSDRTHMLTDVNTTQILLTLDISKRSIQNSDICKIYLLKLVEKSTSEDDKQFAREFVVRNTYQLLRKYQENVLRNFEDMDINVSINVT